MFNIHNTRKHISWGVTKGPNETYLVVGEHADKKREVYQFMTFSMAKFAKERMERLTPSSLNPYFVLYEVGNGATLELCSGTDGVISSNYLTPAFLSEQLQFRNLVRRWLRIDDRIAAVKHIYKLIMWGTNGKHC
jgi:hypothetical protein